MKGKWARELGGVSEVTDPRLFQHCRLEFGAVLAHRKFSVKFCGKKEEGGKKEAL